MWLNVFFNQTALLSLFTRLAIKLHKTREMTYTIESDEKTRKRVLVKAWQGISHPHNSTEHECESRWGRQTIRLGKIMRRPCQGLARGLEGPPQWASVGLQHANRGPGEPEGSRQITGEPGTGLSGVRITFVSLIDRDRKRLWHLLDWTLFKTLREYLGRVHKRLGKNNFAVKTLKCFLRM